jgi:hypothetical protein
MTWTSLLLDFRPRTVHEGVMTVEIAHVNVDIVTHETSLMILLGSGGKEIMRTTNVPPSMTLHLTRRSQTSAR